MAEVEYFLPSLIIRSKFKWIQKYLIKSESGSEIKTTFNYLLLWKNEVYI